MADFEQTTTKYSICLRVCMPNYSGRTYVLTSKNEFQRVDLDSKVDSPMEFETLAAAEKYFKVVSPLAASFLEMQHIGEVVNNLTCAHRGATLSLIKSVTTTKVEETFNIPELGYQNYTHLQQQ